jgi:hypothetical protein
VTFLTSVDNHFSYRFDDEEWDRYNVDFAYILRVEKLFCDELKKNTVLSIDAYKLPLGGSAGIASIVYLNGVVIAATGYNTSTINTFTLETENGDEVVYGDQVQPAEDFCVDGWSGNQNFVDNVVSMNGLMEDGTSVTAKMQWYPYCWDSVILHNILSLEIDLGFVGEPEGKEVLVN